MSAVYSNRHQSRAHWHLEIYTGLPNYRNSWLDQGFAEDDFVRGGSERLKEAMVAWGDADAVAMANATRYGLAASVWTRDLSRAHRIAAKLDAGTVWVNCWMLRDLRVPFGGVKDSGIGREGGHEALRFFSDVSNVCIATGEPA